MRSNLSSSQAFFRCRRTITLTWLDGELERINQRTSQQTIDEWMTYKNEQQQKKIKVTNDSCLDIER